MNENSAIFIVLMTIIGLAAWLVNKMIKTRHSPPRPETLDAAREIEKLRSENDRLHERLAVLERIATVWQVRSAPHCAATPGGRGDLPNAERTAREIEQLRQG